MYSAAVHSSAHRCVVLKLPLRGTTSDVQSSGPRLLEVVALWLTCWCLQGYTGKFSFFFELAQWCKDHLQCQHHCLQYGPNWFILNVDKNRQLKQSAMRWSNTSHFRCHTWPIAYLSNDQVYKYGGYACKNFNDSRAFKILEDMSDSWSKCNRSLTLDIRFKATKQTGTPQTKCVVLYVHFLSVFLLLKWALIKSLSFEEDRQQAIAFTESILQLLM